MMLGDAQLVVRQFDRYGHKLDSQARKKSIGRYLLKDKNGKVLTRLGSANLIDPHLKGFGCKGIESWARAQGTLPLTQTEAIDNARKYLSEHGYILE